MKVSENTFIHLIDKETGEETYKIQFDYGTQKINVKEGTKITLDYVHGGFEEYFSRVGDDLIIGDDLYICVMQPLGVGYGKEVWNITDNGDDTYIININKYSWAGSSYGYADVPRTTEIITMTADELAEFQTKHGVNVNVGANTLYTTWPVLPNPEIHYYMQDYGFYAPANGKIILKDYFKYGKDTIFIGDRLLSDIIKNNKRYEALINANIKKSYTIYDSFFDETLYGGNKADKIYSSRGDDTIEPGKGNDKIYLGEGNKTIVINEGEGKDIIYNFEKAGSLNLKVDTDDVYFTKSKNDLILNRDYFDKTEQTVIKNYFKNYTKDNNIIVSNGEEVLVSDFTKGWTESGAYLKAVGNKTIKGTDFNDEAYSSAKNETFILGKGNDIIHFKNDGHFGVYPYNFGNDVVKLTASEKVILDFSYAGGRFSYERKGNDCIITARHQIELCGRSTGKEEWNVKGVNGSYQITKTKYYFTGSGFAQSGKPTTETMTADEFKEFQKKNGVTLKTGKNTLYTSWAVVPNPVIHYSMIDSSNWGAYLGSVTLKDYFKLNEDSVYIGDKSLREYLKNYPDMNIIDMSGSKSVQKISDTYMDETIIGSGFSDKIISDSGNDTISAGKGDDVINLGEGNKTVKINKGEGKDIISVGKNNDSVNIVFDDDVEGLSFRKSGQNLIINREYGNKKESTLLRGFYKKDFDADINIFVGDDVIFSGLDKNITNQQWQVVCEYPLIDSAIPVDWTVICEYPPVEKPIVEEPVGGCLWICEYLVATGFDVNQINQNISAWQTDSSDLGQIVLPSQDTEIMPVLVGQG